MQRPDQRPAEQTQPPERPRLVRTTSDEIFQRLFAKDDKSDEEPLQFTVPEHFDNPVPAFLIEQQQQHVVKYGDTLPSFLHLHPPLFVVGRLQDPEPPSPQLEGWQVRCDCHVQLPGDMTDYARCQVCRISTHKSCVRQMPGLAHGFACNTCQKGEVLRQLEQCRWYPESPYRDLIAAYRHYIREPLWQLYCSLPDDRNTPIAVCARTSRDNLTGERLPTRGRPAAWARKVEAGLFCLLTTSNRQTVNSMFVSVVPASGFDLDYTSKLRQLAHLYKAEGEYGKDQKKMEEELGVVLEVFGVVRKGRYWKG